MNSKININKYINTCICVIYQLQTIIIYKVLTLYRVKISAFLVFPFWAAQISVSLSGQTVL